ncbi:hypothetical protein C1H69_18960 [Billgrantia endophytica]|uniref:Uncharacterized protein n=1 Tax=Billgrantia endophytica TaxID=2033802 RepID=A0A2N7TY07_9GAMM|nr:hypothetical protein C1H69_18960 [Halomonas endophytica]
MERCSASRLAPQAPGGGHCPRQLRQLPPFANRLQQDRAALEAKLLEWAEGAGHAFEATLGSDYLSNSNRNCCNAF